MKLFILFLITFITLSHYTMKVTRRNHSIISCGIAKSMNQTLEGCKRYERY
jgi:hypothetical protein